MSFWGTYDVHIKWKGCHIPKSPFRVVVSSEIDASDGEDLVKPPEEKLLGLFMFHFGVDSNDVEPYLIYSLGGF